MAFGYSLDILDESQSSHGSLPKGLFGRQPIAIHGETDLWIQVILLLLLIWTPKVFKEEMDDEYW